MTENTTAAILTVRFTVDLFLTIAKL